MFFNLLFSHTHMNIRALLIPVLVLGGGFAAHGHDLPPSETSPYERLSPSEHAELYLNLVSHLYYALIDRMDRVYDTATAQEHGPTIIALHRRLNMAIDHMEHNPDMRREVVRILQKSDTRRRRLIEEEALYHQKAQQFRNNGFLPEMPSARRVTLPPEAVVPSA